MGKTAKSKENSNPLNSFIDDIARRSQQNGREPVWKDEFLRFTETLHFGDPEWMAMLMHANDLIMIRSEAKNSLDG